jgi:peptidoglycan/xylan/chitin deacetylase (PgdA/CDA1 family)
MYHNIEIDKLDVFERHLENLISKYHVVVPGDELKKDKISVCLTFDDAYLNFYKVVFPILLKHKVKSVISVPVGVIDKDKDLFRNDNSIFHSDIYKNIFCSWDELRELVNSGIVTIASHGYSHCDMSKNIDENSIYKEVVTSKLILEEKLKTKINIFVYPYGKSNNKNHNFIKQNYEFNMRIGSSINKNWYNINNYIYRIDADNYWPNLLDISKIDLFKYFIKYLINSIRGK